MSATGSWLAVIDSPMGPAEITLELFEIDGDLSGTASYDGDTVKISEGSADGDHLHWTLFVTKPVKMKLIVNVLVEGDTFAGTAKPNVFPATAVTGSRLRGSSQSRLSRRRITDRGRPST